MDKQIRTHEEWIIGEKKTSLKLSNSEEQRLIREFRSPMPDEGTKQSDIALMENAVWRG